MPSDLNSILFYTNKEKDSLEKYILNNADVVNMFLERGIENEKNLNREININTKELEDVIRQILNIYSIMYKNVKKNYIDLNEKFSKIELKEILERLDLNTRFNSICEFREKEEKDIMPNEGILYITKDIELPYIKIKDIITDIKEDRVLLAPFIQVTKVEKFKNDEKVDCINLKLEKQKILMVSEIEISKLQKHIFANVDDAILNLKKYLDLEKAIKKELMQRDTYTYRLAGRDLSKEDREKIDLEVEKINDLVKEDTTKLEICKNNYIEWKENTNYYIKYMCEKIKETIDIGYQKELEYAKNVVKEEEIKGYKEMLILSRQNTLDKIIKNKKGILQIVNNLNRAEIKQEKFKDLSTKIRINYQPYCNIEKDLKEVNLLLDKIDNLKEQIQNINLDVKEGLNFDKENQKINTILQINMDIEKWVENILEKELQNINKKELLYFKRSIYNRIEEDKALANIKIINDENEKINNKSNLKKILDKITGQAKKDEFILKQNIIKEKAIKEKIKDVKVEIKSSYSAHDMAADLDIFIKENKDKEVIERDIHRLKTLRNNIGEIFKLSEESIDTIIENRLKNNLPIKLDKKRIDKFKKIEMETENFLIKNRYVKTSEDALTEILGESKALLANETKKLIAYIEENKN